MSDGKSEKGDSAKQHRTSKDRAAEVANTFEWLITAFILAFVFRAFVMEAFRIPTGSMADTLNGAHFRLRCRQCGYEYDYGFVPGRYFDSQGHRLPEDTVPAGKVPLAITRCPNCGHYPTELVCRRCGLHYDSRIMMKENRFRRGGGSTGEMWVPPTSCPRCNGELMSVWNMPVANGDRILVLKCIYQFIHPKRWDVIVFKNPTDPTINYIKRLIGLPGEKVEIIDGDVYIDNKITRKPPKVQNELWMPVYNNDYQPARPKDGNFNGHTWSQPFKNVSDSIWNTTNSNSPTIFTLESAVDRINTIFYDTLIGNNFRTIYAYDEINRYDEMPICSDLMVRFHCLADGSKGRIGIALSKYETNYKAWVDLAGEMIISRIEQGKQSQELARRTIEPSVTDEPVLVSFANVDHLLIFQYGNNKLTFDLGRNMEDAGPIKENIEPRVEIFGSGKLTLSHIAIFRDIHYTNPGYPGRNGQTRASRGNPFSLEKDQFFVLGDNSPNSEDARLWNSPGMANKGLPEYREGTVPRDYLVGKALFVYWPSGFKPFDEFPFGIIPNVGRMRFIYGGSNGGD
jgi:signal peptidase I